MSTPASDLHSSAELAGSAASYRKSEQALDEPAPVRRKRDRTAISSPYLHRLQRRHFLLFDVLPFVGTLCAFGLLYYQPLTAVDVGLFFLMWALTGFALTVGFHRLFTHRAFKTSAPVRVIFTILGCMAARGPMISWTAMHRRHHELADHEGDMHSPNMHGTTLTGRLRGWWHAHVGWMIRHEYPNVAHYVPDLLADKPVVKADRMYHLWIVAGLAVPALLGGWLTHSWIGALTGFLWGGVVRMFVVEQSVSALNSLLHLFGSRPFKMQDNRSHNNPLLAILTWGEGWHNNHHAFPASASFGLKWYEIDFGYWVVLALEACGFVWDVRRIEPERIEARKAVLNARMADALDR
ncbi:acyl-CoA desaturase [Burkholderia singularis]|uniref:Fatty acid desaturase Delta-9 fatty acid desaturase n=1 Tax=Burkholderia singularis TaxID=1503053 RepID=A0A238H3J4_9BURK|nr:acyl-CoA desaturase [Burkholderia singularis]SMF99747.1 Fatty acid desaturase; Delta-9 fatty acid desaturase [Burkholderia singularis]